MAFVPEDEAANGSSGWKLDLASGGVVRVIGDPSHHTRSQVAPGKDLQLCAPVSIQRPSFVLVSSNMWRCSLPWSVAPLFVFLHKHSQAVYDACIEPED